MKEIEITSGCYGSYHSSGAIVCNNSYLDIHYSSNFTHNNISGRRSGAMMLYTCSLIIQGNASFVGNEAALFRGGAMLLQNTDSNSNGNLLLKKTKLFGVEHYQLSKETLSSKVTLCLIVTTQIVEVVLCVSVHM